MSEESKTTSRGRPVKAADGEIPAEAAKATRQVWWLVGGAVLVVLVLTALAAAQWKFAWIHSWPHRDEYSSITLPQQSPAPVVAEPVQPAPVNVAAARRALAPYLVGESKAALGPHVDIWVTGLKGGATYSSGTSPITPASILKLLTTTAALDVMGPGKRFATSVRQTGPSTITLVGGGDIYLAKTPSKAYPQAANLTDLAQRTAVSLKAKGLRSVTVNYDASLFSGPGLNPRWEPNYFPEGIIAPISALWVDEAMLADGTTAADPASAAAATFVGLLKARGIEVVGARRAVSAAGAPVIAAVQSATLANQVAQVLTHSDNFGAEVLARQVAVATGRPATFSGAITAIKTVLARANIPLDGLTMYDGSGLSRQDRLTPATLAAVLKMAASTPKLSGVIGGLPVAGFDGTLGYRFRTTSPHALGLVRAKTGTLTGVHSIAGLVIDADGNPIVYVAIADQVPVALTTRARDALDEIGAALSLCRCTVSP